jgi:hypothetical protein
VGPSMRWFRYWLAMVTAVVAVEAVIVLTMNS